MSLVFLISPEFQDTGADFVDKSDKFFYSKMPTVKVFDGGDIEGEAEEFNIYDNY